MRKGYGVDYGEGANNSKAANRRFRTAILYGRLMPDEAMKAWQAAGGAPDGGLEEVLQRDAVILERFREIRTAFLHLLHRQSGSQAFELLLDRLGLWGYWHAREHGAQRVANLRAFLELVRGFEADSGAAPHRLVRWLSDLAGGDDPPTGGLDAGGIARVVVTTYWQAKGRQWPVVVLPDLHKTTASSGGLGLGCDRLLPFDLDDGRRSEPIMVPEIRLTDPAVKPFSAERTGISTLVDAYRRPLARAEMRRLLYVAMTRAESQLILLGQFDGPGLGRRRLTMDLQSNKQFGLRAANNWANLLMVCLDLGFQPDGRPLLGPQGVWKEGEDVVLHTPKDLVLAMLPGGLEGTREPKPAELKTLAAAWEPVGSVERRVVNPSRVAIPHQIPVGRLAEGQWPAQRADTTGRPFQENEAGTAFHKLMELWGFGLGGTIAEVAKGLWKKRGCGLPNWESNG